MFDKLFEAIAGPIGRNEIMPLAAIWMDSFVNVLRDGALERTKRVVPGDRIRVVNGEIVPMVNVKDATHQISQCMGTVDSMVLEFTIVDLKSNEISKLSV